MVTITMVTITMGTITIVTITIVTITVVTVTMITITVVSSPGYRLKTRGFSFKRNCVLRRSESETVK